MPKLDRVFAESAALVKDCYAMILSKKLEKFALLALAQKKKAAKLGKE